MNFRAIALPIGRLLILISLLMIIPAIADAFAAHPDWRVFLVSGLLLGTAGILTTIAFRGEKPPIHFREAIVFVNASWFAFSLAAAVPFYFSGLGISFTDAFFEAVSGLTTTGSTVLTGLDGFPPGILLWRALLQWVGGIGVVALGIWLLPGLRVGGSQLFALESSEKTSKPYGKIAPFVYRLLVLYGTLTLGCLLLYRLCGMSFFNAIVHSMTTVSTGGFSTSDRSFSQFSGTAVYWVASLFMLLSSVPFLYLIRSLERRRFDRDTQIGLLLFFVTAASFGVFYFERFIVHDTPFHMFTLAVFNVVSVITTTGYAANDYLQFGPAVIAIFFVLTFFGGCSGSTAGGFKMFRIAVLTSYIQSLLRRIVRPHRVAEPRYQGHAVTGNVLEGILIFAVLYTGAFAAFSVIYMMLDLDLETALSASITALANVGPGVGNIIGPSGTFQTLPDAAKWFLALEMIIGRLEIIAAILLLTPDYWLD
ncbi:trk system potassium uptake protein TrkH [Roseibium marinum]|uniref:Trk system potassium uptake protein n=2 Tax=Roseibium marinum TaxID=281252 RepID=A0A2S3UZJ5_9HYPH|nr:trk system potassium uptake protein TrkH [Roseibium marinum]